MSADFVILKVVCGLSSVPFLVLAAIAYRESDDIVGYAITTFIAAVAVGGLALALLARPADENGGEVSWLRHTVHAGPS